jgi:hypothetical protein
MSAPRRGRGRTSRSGRAASRSRCVDARATDPRSHRSDIEPSAVIEPRRGDTAASRGLPSALGGGRFRGALFGSQDPIRKGVGSQGALFWQGAVL